MACMPAAKNGSAMHIRLLGSFEARSREGMPMRPPGRRSIALVACLALRPEGWERDALAALLWHDRPPEQARASLRQELLRLRGSLGPVVGPASSSGALLMVNPDFEYDVLRFRLAAQHPSRSLEAVALYRGDLLDPFTMPRNPVLAERLTLYRAELRADATRCLRTILQSTEASEPIARRLLEFDPASDDAHAWLIQHYLELGHNAQALAAYGTYLQAIEARGARPSVWIQQLVAAAARQTVPAVELENGSTTTRQWMQYVRANACSPGRPNARRLAVVTERPSLVVLPATDLSPGKIGSMFADGLIEELTNALARIPGFFVTSRHSAWVYRDAAIDVRDIAAELGVRYVLESSIEVQSQRIRVNVRLLDGSTGLSLWADTQDRHPTDLFAIRDETVQAIAARLQPRLVDQEVRLALRRPIEDLDAWGWMQRAQAGLLLARDRDALEAAIQPLESALRADPRYAMAHALLGAVHTWRYLSRAFPDRDRERDLGLKHANRALQLEGDNPFVLTHCTEPAIYLAGDLDHALQLLELAIERNPNEAYALALLGHTRRMIGDDPRTSLALIEQATRISPQDPRSFSWSHYGSWCHWRLDDLPAMERASRRSIELYSAYPNSWIALVCALGLQQKTQEAREAGRVLQTLAPNFRASQFYGSARRVYAARFPGRIRSGYMEIRKVLSAALPRG